MTINEVIKSERIKAENLKEHINSPEPGIKASKCLDMAEEHEQIAKWLEELEELRAEIAELHCERQAESVFIKERDAEIRAEAIDEFVELYEKFCNSDIVCGSEDCIGKFCPRCFRDNFMEQVKEQNK